MLRFQPGAPLVVTGAGSGIGRAVALMAAELGLAVVAWDLDDAGVGETAECIRAGGATAVEAVVDVADQSEVQLAWDAAEARLGPVAHLAAVAGPPSFVDRTFDEAVLLALACMRVPTECWASRADSDGGSAVYLSSVQGPRYGAGVPWYSVAKAAIDGYARSVAAMRPGGLRANAVLPDWTDTPRTAPHAAGKDPAWSHNPMGRMGQPRDVAAACLYLLSPAAEYVNGQSLEVDGGASRRSAAWLAGQDAPA